MNQTAIALKFSAETRTATPTCVKKIYMNAKGFANMLRVCVVDAAKKSNILKSMDICASNSSISK